MRKILLTLLVTITLSASTGILKQDANFRDKPSLNKSIVLETYKRGTKVEVINKVISDKYGTWYETNKGFVSSELLEVKDIVTKAVNKDKKYFLEVSTGLSVMSVSQYDRTGSMTLKKPDDKGFNLNFAVGYNYSKDTFATVGVYHHKYSDTKFYNYLVTYNKKLKDMPYNAYAGLVGGISYIEITKAQINAPILKSKSRKLALGVQVGFEEPLEKDLTLFGQYRYLKAEHTTSLESNPAKSDLIRDDYSTFSIGVRWSFNSFDEIKLN